MTSEMHVPGVLKFIALFTRQHERSLRSHAWLANEVVQATAALPLPEQWPSNFATAEFWAAYYRSLSAHEQ